MAKKFILIENFDENYKKSNNIIDIITGNNKDNYIIGGNELFEKEKIDIELLYVIKDDDLNIKIENYLLFENHNINNTLIKIYINIRKKSSKFEIEYQNEDCVFMLEAKKLNKDIYQKLLDKNFGKVHVTSALIEKDNKILGKGVNSDYHLENGCIRKDIGSKSGEDYHLCIGCQPLNHGEQNAIKDSIKNGFKEYLGGSNLFLYGHYCPCISCTKIIEEKGIKKVYISKKFTKDFFNIKI